MEQRNLKKGLRNYFIINEAIHPVGLYIIIEFVLPTSQSRSLKQTSTVGNISKPVLKTVDTTGPHSSEFSLSLLWSQYELVCDYRWL